jgi:hypothetical protein
MRDEIRKNKQTARVDIQLFIHTNCIRFSMPVWNGLLKCEGGK